MWAIRQAISFIRFGFPYFIRAVLSGLGMALHLSFLNVLSLMAGSIPVARKLGKDWSEEAIERGLFPSIYEEQLAEFLMGIGLAAIYIGYAVNVFTAAFMVIFIYIVLTSP